jgi:phosphoenolpyruvate carboxykinase (ATP)
MPIVESVARGTDKARAVHYQCSPAQLVEEALKRGEGRLSDTGALVVQTGKYTGRSPNDRFIVDSSLIHSEINWGKNNLPIPPSVFERLLEKFEAALTDKELFVFDGYAGADPEYAIPVRFITELASQNLFVHQLFIRPTAEQLQDFTPAFTVISLPSLELDPTVDGVHSEAAVVIDLEKKIILVSATHYNGELKKSVFSVLNFLLPHCNVFPMHCSVNVGKDGKSAIFFGLSGTGKTTLSADPERTLIGDDEHGWSDKGLFNFEGGCYAKCIHLSPETEPEIFRAIRFGAIAENVILDPQTRQVDFDDQQITENTRVAYPIHFITNASPTGMAPHPSVILFLTADAFGVLPAISRLEKAQAQYHFISGYTSKLAGTERGITEPVAAFSTCFGSPFMPCFPSVYAQLLEGHIERHDVEVYLLNTGWQGGAYGTGKRISIPLTRQLVRAALNGDLKQVDYTLHPVFNIHIPRSCPGVPPEMLDPRGQWQDEAAYDQAASNLARLFVQNFKNFPDAAHLVHAGPRL